MPLTYEQNGYCLAIGAFTLIWGVIIKLILPSKLFKCLALDEREEADNESFVSSFRRKSVNAPRTSLQDRIGQNLVAKLNLKVN